MKDYLLFIILIPVLVIMVLIVLVAIKIAKGQITRKKIFKEDRDSDEINQSQRRIYLEAFGGSENIVSVSFEMSRLTVKTKDLEKVQFEKLKELGAGGILVMGNEVKCSFKEQAEYIYQLIK